MTQHKTMPAVEARVAPEGVFTALVAAFDNVDRAKDVIRRGAFTKSLDEWRARGARIPIVWSHQSGDPAMVIGSADAAKSYESASGLVLSGRLNLDTSAVADHVYDLLAAGDISGWSFAYNIVRSRPGKNGVTELLQLDLVEAGPTPAPANPAARTLSVKGQELPDEDGVPSHTEVEGKLREAGIIGPIVPSDRDHDAIREGERQAMAAAMGHRTNGDRQDEHGKSAPAITVEGFPCS